MKHTVFTCGSSATVVSLLPLFYSFETHSTAFLLGSGPPMMLQGVPHYVPRCQSTQIGNLWPKTLRRFIVKGVEPCSVVLPLMKCENQ